MNVKHSKKQAGGTLLGLVIGLIIGLGIAVVVAVAITKTPMPFFDKTGKQDKPEKIAGPSASAMADPNKPMYGKQDAAKAAARELVRKEPPAASAAKDYAARRVVNAKTVDTKAVDTKAVDAKPAASEDKWIYYLQAGAFREEVDAESVRAKLALQGFEASVSEKPSENGPLYRVRLGPYGQLEVMNRVRSKLSDSGIDVVMVRIAK
ncbi:MAG TPA: SPOR domain-containing protein [Burkholderiaceae bacterium]|nr:SPOR domain-containing protein [Burkholderiaceae bacterium]